MKIKVGDTVEILPHTEMCGPSDVKLHSKPNGRVTGIMYVRDSAIVLERTNVQGLVWCKLRTEHSQIEGWCLQCDLCRLDRQALTWKKEARASRKLSQAGDVLKVRSRVVGFKLRKSPDTLENALVPDWYDDIEAYQLRESWPAEDDRLAVVLESIQVPFTGGRVSEVDCFVFLLEVGTVGWIDAGFLVPKDMT